MLEEDAPIRLVAYDPQWPQLFLEEREALQRILKPWLAGPIEHVGSTAVPGLTAKPVIDIMAAVESLEGSREASIALQELDYLYAPYNSGITHWFCKPRRSFRTHHLTLIPFGSEAWIATLAFRDRLRDDRNVAIKYLDLKQSLATAFEYDREAYTKGKTAFVSKVVSETLANIKNPCSAPERC